MEMGQTANSQLQAARQENHRLIGANRALQAESQRKQQQYEDERLRRQAERVKQQEARQERERMRRDNAEALARKRQLQQEASRNERFRLRDPIHIYALQGGESGAKAEDWKMVLDYHKGANEIDLGEPRADGSQVLEITVGTSVMNFNLVVPRDINSAKVQFPLCPKVLCADF